jgi:hypothetical protein
MKTKMFLKFIIASVFLALIPGFVNAQQIISSSGIALKNSTGSLSFTLGELVIDTKNVGETTITQGFHQTKLTITVIHFLREQNFSISAFPNPTHDFVNLKIEKGDIRDIEIVLFDLQGKVLSTQKIESTNTEVSFSGYNPGNYLLKVIQKGKEIRTFKVIKN